MIEVNIDMRSIDSALDQISDAIDAISASARRLAQSIRGLRDALVDLITSANPISVFESFRQILSTLVLQINTSISAFFALGASVIEHFIQGMMSMVNMLLSQASQMIASLIQTVKAHLDDILQTGMLVVQHLIDGIRQNIPEEELGKDSKHLKRQAIWLRTTCLFKTPYQLRLYHEFDKFHIRLMNLSALNLSM